MQIREKQKQLRWLVLDRCLADQRHKYTTKDLSKKVGEALFGCSGAQVNPRLVLGDIEYMKEKSPHHAPIEEFTDKNGKRYHRYNKKDYSIYRNTLPFEDINILSSTLNSLYLTLLEFQKENRTFGCELIKEIIPYLEDRLGVRTEKGARTEKEDTSLSEQRFDLQGLEHLVTIAKAIILLQPLKIHYQTFNGHELEITCHPNQVRLHNKMWLMMGWTEQYGKQGCYALDKIVSLEHLESPFIMKGNMIHEKYFKAELKNKE